MEAQKQALIKFLLEEMSIPLADVQLALHNPEQMPNLLPMILWQYGLVTIAQLSYILDWMEQYIWTQNLTE
jgi:hypothetical protein